VSQGVPREACCADGRQGGGVRSYQGGWLAKDLFTGLVLAALLLGVTRQLF
jgi:hypothetical protein